MLPIIQMASVTGVYGVSFLVAWTSVAMATLAVRVWRNPASRETIWGSAGLPLITCVIIAATGAAKTAALKAPEQTLRVAMVQPSFPQTMIWDPNGDAARFEKVMGLSGEALAEEPDLLIWPESGAPDMTAENQRALGQLLRQHKAWMILCVDSEEKTAEGGEAVYNSGVLLDPEGKGKGMYHKRRLVMFGEYVPLIRWLPFLKFLAPIGSGFSPGREATQFEMSRPRAKMSVLICFEDIFAREAREHVEADTDMLVNLTNDGWFGEGAAQWQQTANAVFRAVENGIPLARCSNNGITCWIDARGRLRDILGAPDKVYGPGVLLADIPLERGGAARRATFYNRHGDCFGWGCCAAAWGFLGLAWRRRDEARRETVS